MHEIIIQTVNEIAFCIKQRQNFAHSIKLRVLFEFKVLSLQEKKNTYIYLLLLLCRRRG